MREIKFRVWDKECKQMVYRDLDTFAKFGCPFIPMQEAIERGDIMQYIGLLDKNSKEIFEGDIVCIDEALHNCKIVIWKDEKLQWQLKNLDIDTSFELYIPYKNTKDFEIIGNIYENPELLEAK